MASFGVRVLEKTDRVLKLRLVILNPDYFLFPRTHAFGLFLLWEGLKKKGWTEDNMISQFLLQQFVIGEFKAKAPVAIEKMVVSDFQNLREPSTHEKIRSKFNPAADGFMNEDELPSAQYELVVRMPEFLSHLEKGMIWESDGKEMDEMRHYLERRDDTGNWFIESSMDGKFHVMREGKEGEEGKETKTRTASHVKALEEVASKLKKGYSLSYKNFDSPYGLEFDLLRELEQPGELF